MQIWIIGTAADCDIIVDQPKVSRRHCRLTNTGNDFTLEDLGSSNGTYVNGERINAVTLVSPADTITLGATVPLPWPDASPFRGARIVRIGRNPDNDMVLDDERISGHHARLIISDSQVLIEDLRSSNGTFVNSSDRKATTPIPLLETDVVSFGSLTVPAARILSTPIAPANKRATAPPVADPQPVTSRVAAHLPLSKHATILSLLAVLAQAPIIAIMIVTAYGRGSSEAINPDNWSSVGAAIAAVAFTLSLAAIWLGGTLAVWAATVGKMTSRSAAIGSNLLLISALCIAECIVLLSIVHAGSGLKGSWLGMLGILVLVSTIGVSFGLFVFQSTPNRAWGASALLLAFALIFACGGWAWPLHGANPGIQVMSSITPTRWAFEALLVIEADARVQPLQPENVQAAAGDIVEAFFGAETERMGPEADSLALAATLISLGSVAALVFVATKPSPYSGASTA